RGETADRQESRPLFEWNRRTTAAVVAFAMVTAVSWTLLARKYAVPPDTRVRLAVVPFDNETGLAEYDRLAQTLTDATVARLAAQPDRLAVIGNAAALREARSRRDLKAIGSTLDVEYVILGQVQQIDGQLRVTAHLIRVQDQSHIWAHRFEPSTAEM